MHPTLPVLEPPAGKASLARPAMTWVQVERGFHVGNTNGNFVGSIDLNATGTFTARDARARPLGDFTTLVDAKRTITASQNSAAYVQPPLNREDRNGRATRAR